MVLTILILGVLGDSYYKSAMEQLSDISIYKTNFTQIIENLEYSSYLGNFEATAKLGEIYLIGLPISPQNLSSKALLDENNLFRRDVKKALDYFHRAHINGSRDAPYFLGFLLWKSLLVDSFDQYIPFQDVQAVIKSLYTEALIRNSPYAISSIANSYQACINRYKQPDLLYRNMTIDFITAPFFDDPNCGKSCEDLAHKEMNLAQESLQGILKEGGEELSANRIDSTEDHLFGKESIKAQLYQQLKYHDAQNQAQNYATLGLQYMFGNPTLGIDKDLEQSKYFFDQAEKLNNKSSLESLAVLYLHGIGVEQNTTKALDYINRAIKQGSASAYNGLGYLHYNGIGVKKDIRLAYRYFSSAADLGSIEAFGNLGYFYLKGLAVEQSFSEAGRYFSSAAQAGHIPSMYNYGLMNLYGLGTKRSCRNALNLFRKIREKGELQQIITNAYLSYKLGDFEGAYLGYSLGASLGYETALLSAGFMWESKQVPMKCRFEENQCASAFYQISANAHNSEWGFYNMGDIAFQDKQYQMAEEYYKQSPNNPTALYNRGFMAEYGLGQEKDYNLAQEFYQKVLDGAENGIWEEQNAYPAKIAIAKVGLKAILGEYSFVDSLVDYF